MKNEEIEFSKGFTDLHTLSYQNIISTNIINGLRDTKNSIEVVSQNRINELHKKNIKLKIFL